MRSAEVQIVGAGPAGTAAAITALSNGAGVHMWDRSRAPRHKVCGEFVAAEACQVLDELGAWQDVLRLNPGRITQCRLYFGTRGKQWRLAEPACGVSRLQLDRLLLERATALGATVSVAENFRAGHSNPSGALVVASGRKGTARGPGRLFGFKAHFTGPTDDTVELHFTRFGYVGISTVENALTNVCGIAPEDVLRRRHFEIDELLRSEPALADRLRPLARKMQWLKVGPLTFSAAGELGALPELTYSAGDALGFVDPFTGSGILNALLTGRLAGAAAVQRRSTIEYLRTCKALLGRPFAAAAVFRLLVRARLSDLSLLVPGNWLYRLTRPSIHRNV